MFFIRDLTFSRRDFFLYHFHGKSSSLVLNPGGMKSRIRIYFYKTGKHLWTWTWSHRYRASEMSKGGSRHKLDQCASENHVFISEQSDVSDLAVSALNYIRANLIQIRDPRTGWRDLVREFPVFIGPGSVWSWERPASVRGFLLFTILKKRTG